MHAGLFKLGRWVLGAGLASAVVLAHAHPAFAPAGSHGGAGARAPAMRSAPWGGGGFHGGGNGERGGNLGFGGVRSAVFSPQGGSRAPGREDFSGVRGGMREPAPVRVADQGGRRERGGARSHNAWPGPAEAPSAPHYGGASYGGFGAGGGYRGNPITPVSAETHQVPHPPADSPVRAGSIREDVARYNEERAAFRPMQRGGDVPRPPMPSPYRN